MSKIKIICNDSGSYQRIECVTASGSVFFDNEDPETAWIEAASYISNNSETDEIDMEIPSLIEKNGIHYTQLYIKVDKNKMVRTNVSDAELIILKDKTTTMDEYVQKHTKKS
jgi:hypothetical protein